MVNCKSWEKVSTETQILCFVNSQEFLLRLRVPFLTLQGFLFGHLGFEIPYYLEDPQDSTLSGS